MTPALPLKSLKRIPSKELDIVFNILGLTEEERKIMIATSGMIRSTTSLSYYEKIPPSSLKRLLRGLEKRGLVEQTRWFEDKKSLYWRSDLRKAAREISRIFNPQLLNSR